jgi:hypothetical protein
LHAALTVHYASFRVGIDGRRVVVLVKGVDVNPPVRPVPNAPLMKSLGSTKSLRVLTGLYLLTLFYFYLAFSLGTPICFDDCLGYINLMGLGWEDYLHTFWTTYRPWTAQVFFSLFGKYTLISASQIILAQAFLGFFSWILFAYSCRQLFSTPLSRAVAFIVVSSLMFGQGYYHFNQRLLSDSLALTLVLTQFSLCLLSTRYMAWCDTQQKSKKLCIGLYIALLVFVSAAEMAARDANIALACIGLLIVLFYNRSTVFSARNRRLLIVLMVCVALTQSVFAAKRHKLNARNTLAGVVLPNEEIRTFFLEHGMPPELGVAGTTMKPQDLGHVNVDEMNEQVKTSVALAPNYFRKFDRIYLWYLLTHPGYVIGNVIKYWPMIFDQNFQRHITGASLGNEAVFAQDVPGFMLTVISPGSLDVAFSDLVPWGIKMILIAAYLLYASVIVRTREAFLPLVFLIAGASNAVISFFGDVWLAPEMARHAFIGSIVLNIGIALSTLYLLDAAIVVLEKSGRLKLRPSHVDEK